MKKRLLPIVLFLISISINGQHSKSQKPQLVKITAKVLDRNTNKPLEYATLVLQSLRNPDKVTGGISNAQGNFEVEVSPGKYNVRIEYISYKTQELKNQIFNTPQDLGIIKLGVDVAQLNEVEVTAERTTVELRLDKKVYNVGQDLTVKGGSVTDVLDNVPSVTVDEEGIISLRGNESVRVLINGKPSALSGLNSQALQQLPADAIEKVEVITNPSARYDAEGTAGILNIILKQSKVIGINGSFSVYVGNPDNFGGSVNLNMRRDKFNIFTNTSYRYRNAPGNAEFLQENFDRNTGLTMGFQDEFRNFYRKNKNYNTNVGFEYFINKTSSITNSMVYRKSIGGTNVNVDFVNYDSEQIVSLKRNRYTDESENDENIQYSVNYQNKFNDDGHELTLDYQYSSGDEIEENLIQEKILTTNENLTPEQIINFESVVRQLVQMDYKLPFGKDNASQLELGYRGTFNNFNTDYDFGVIENSDFIIDRSISNNLNYKEYVNAAYLQLGSKFNKFNILGGLRYEASDIDVELLDTNDFTNKTYDDWFPSLFLGYEFSETEQITVSYSRRLRRPRSRMINPFLSRSSNTNFFQGNPDLDPTYNDAYDLGYMKRWDKLTLTSSIYYNYSTGVFQFISKETGEFVELEDPNNSLENILVPVQVRQPVNLATATRYGIDFTSTFVPKRKWRLTWNLNLFNNIQKGDYNYVNSIGETVNQNFDAKNLTWFTRLSAKVPLPYKIALQSNIFYRGPRKNAQTNTKGMLSTNLAFSKDILKDKASLSLNISDLFNTRKRQSTTTTIFATTESEFQRRQRQFTLTFQYRFNEPQKQKRGNGMRNNSEDDFEFEG